jgi:hypothetical protein
VIGDYQDYDYAPTKYYLDSASPQYEDFDYEDPLFDDEEFEEDFIHCMMMNVSTLISQPGQSQLLSPPPLR